MIILPAIDILGGNCVRLVKGEYGTAERVAADPYETARRFESEEARYLHLVDLDGAKKGEPANASLLCGIAASIKIPCELGGGIRDMATVEYYLSRGVAKVILGSVALKNPAFVREAAAVYNERVAVGIDARGGKVCAEGWLQSSETDYIEFARVMENCGVKNIIFTDIDRDGTRGGANFAQLAALSEAVGCDITASGGIRDINDIITLADMGLYGAIAGKAIYDGSLSLREAAAICEESEKKKGEK